MANKNVWVSPHGDQWAVKREGAERASSLHDTQRDAIEAGERLAKADAVEIVIQGRDGHIRDRDSYGRDPFPPRDKRH